MSVFAVLTYVPIYALLAYSGTIVSHLRDAPSEIILQVLMQGIGSVVISGITFMRMVETFGPVRTTMITALVPALSASLAPSCFGEPLYWNLLVGLVLVTVGIVFGVCGVACREVSRWPDVCFKRVIAEPIAVRVKRPDGVRPPATLLLLKGHRHRFLLFSSVARIIGTPDAPLFVEFAKRRLRHNPLYPRINC